MSDNNEQSMADPAETGSAVVDADELQKQRDDYYDRLLRKTAEFDNYRKRVERDRQSMAEAVAADVVRDLLPLVDDLERALKSLGPTRAPTAQKPIAAAWSSFIVSSSRSCASAACARSKRSGLISIHTFIRRSRTSPPTAGATAK